MNSRTSIALTIGILFSAYSFAGNDWFVNFNNKSGENLFVSLSPSLNCFYTDTFIPTTIPANSEKRFYLEENNAFLSLCDVGGTTVNKEITLLLGNNYFLTLDSYYGINGTGRYRRVGLPSGWETIANNSYSIKGSEQKIEIWVNYESGSIIKLVGYCNTDARCIY
ncbi:MAG: hypothetical protein K0R49_964 [Burkholderiales bacterium]|jgi:hypothetical protein|nr:hypothetical protein [Burkholderiales bacterium]MCE3268712.1 hypothetical protein [Burkholderiales bacterium]